MTTGTVTISQGGTVEKNWWVQNKRIVEFQIIMTLSSNIASGTTVGTGLPSPAIDGARTQHQNVGHLRIYDGGILKAAKTITSGTRTVMHGIYISEGE